MIQFIFFIEDASENASNVFIFLILKKNNDKYEFKIFNEDTKSIFSKSGDYDFCSNKAMGFINTLGVVKKISKIQHITPEQILFKDIESNKEEQYEDICIEIDLDSDSIPDNDMLRKLVANKEEQDEDKCIEIDLESDYILDNDMTRKLINKFKIKQKH